MVSPAVGVNSAKANIFCRFHVSGEVFAADVVAGEQPNMSFIIIDELLPYQRYRQGVVTLPIDLRYLASTRSDLQREVHHEIIQAIRAYYTDQANAQGIKNPAPGAVTVVQRFGSALNLNVHFHILYLDGVYTVNSMGEVIFR